MDIHEYQAKELLSGYGVPIQRGAVAYSARAGLVCGVGTGRVALGRQGADPFRRPRQGRRHQAVQDLSRGARSRDRRCSAAAS